VESVTPRELHVGVGNIEAARRASCELVEHALRSDDGEVLTTMRSLKWIGEVRNVSALTAYAVRLGRVGQTTGTAKSNQGIPNQVTTASAPTGSAITTGELVARAD
jgi:hypothetical protein